MKTEKEKADKATDLVMDLLDQMKELDLDPDYAAFVMLSTGMGLAIASNRDSPIVVNQLLASSMLVANQNVLGAESDQDEEEEDTDGTVH
jgi:hypothetical protein